MIAASALPNQLKVVNGHKEGNKMVEDNIVVSFEGIMMKDLPVRWKEVNSTATKSAYSGWSSGQYSRPLKERVTDQSPLLILTTLMSSDPFSHSSCVLCRSNSTRTIQSSSVSSASSAESVSSRTVEHLFAFSIEIALHFASNRSQFSCCRCMTNLLASSGRLFKLL